MKTVHVVIPCRNARKYLSWTLESIIRQRIDLSLLSVYVADGASSDGSSDMAEEMLSGSGVRYLVDSRPDTGMYEALSRGLAASSSDVTCYLNAGDYWHPSALRVVLSLLDGGSCRWLTGLQVRYAPSGALVGVSLPYKYRKRWIRSGIYGTILPHIQQESTFWDTSLLSTVDLGLLANFKFAGDFYLWKSFASEADLRVVYAHLGGWLMHGDHLSDGDYEAEQASLMSPRRWGDGLAARLERLVWLGPNGLKARVLGAVAYYDPVGGWVVPWK